MKKALITGITGQDGAWLADFLIEKGYQVHGIKRKTSLINTHRIDHIYKDPHDPDKHLVLHYGDLTDSLNITKIINQVAPDEIYNLGAMSHVKVSFEEPEYTANVNGLGTLRVLEAIRILDMGNKTRIYQASTSEMFGKAQEVPQTEKTPFYPRSPYGIAKLFAYWTIVNYREAYNFFAVNGILFNHESATRGETFVTRKITRAVADIFHGKQKKLYLGNLNATRDWGHAKDYVEAMWLMLQHSTPEDFVIATGNSMSVRDFTAKAFECIDIELEFEGTGNNEKGIVKSIPPGTKHLKKGDIIVEIDANYYRPTEVDALLGDASKARKLLGWKPKYSIDDLVKEMVSYEMNNY